MNQHRNTQDTTAPLAGICAAAALVALPAVLIGIALGRALRRRKPLLFAAAVVGAGVTALLYPSITSEMSDAITALGSPKRGPGMSGMAEAVWPHMRTWWALTMGAAPAIGLMVEAVRPGDVEEQVRTQEWAREKQQQRREKKARKAIGLPKIDRTGPSFALGRHLDGDKLLPTKRGNVALPVERLEKTVLVVGAPGSGKTETLLRLAHGAATETDWSVFVLDAKGDGATMARFNALMQRAGRGPRLFPMERYDGWRGTGREIASRLVELIDWAEEGGGTFYRDLSVNLVRLACTAPDGPPRSSRELLDRLDRTVLADLWVGHPQAAELRAFKDEHVNACRQRYAAFFHAINGQLDGHLAFEDTDCAAGTKMEIESSLQHQAGRSLELGSARAQHQYKVAPNDVRALNPGGCYVIGNGKAQKVQIAPTPGPERPRGE